jgi:molecular chaperone GrpE
MAKDQAESAAVRSDEAAGAAGAEPSPTIEEARRNNAAEDAAATAAAEDAATASAGAEPSPTIEEARRDNAAEDAAIADAAASSPATAEASPEAELAALVAERDTARQQAQEYLTLAQRGQADFQNYRRRAEQERAEAYDRGRGEVVLQILPVLDDFERAMAALPPERQDEDWIQGLRLIERKLRSTLERLGVERIAAEGQPFDPWEHEAVLHEVREDVEPGQVATVARQGYRLGSRVLRPAQVVVAKQP